MPEYIKDYDSLSQGTAPLRGEYDKGFNAFTNGESFNRLWHVRKKEGWRSALKKEILFGECLIADGKCADGSIARLGAAGIMLNHTALVA